MFKNKNTDGSYNISANRIKELRKQNRLSQRGLADELQLLGFDIGKNGIQQIESGQRFVTDLELAYFSYFFEIPMDELVEFGPEYILTKPELMQVAEEEEEL